MRARACGRSRAPLRQALCRQSAARAAARFLLRTTPPRADVTPSLAPAASWPPHAPAAEAAALADAPELEPIRRRLRGALATLAADADDSVRIAALHAIKALARAWAAEPAARGLLVAALGASLAEAVARPALATKELVDRTIFRLLLGGAAASNAVGPEAVGAELKSLAQPVLPALSEVCARRLSRLDPEESAHEDELDAFY